MRTYEVTLVTLDTVFLVPYRNEGGNATLFISGSALFPSTVFRNLEGAHRKEVTVLCVDRTNEVRDESRFFANNLLIFWQVSPSGLNRELLIFATAVNGLIVLVNNVLTLLAIRLHDEFLHLLNSEFNRDNLRDTEEGRLQDGVGAVAKTDFLSNLRCIDIINSDVVLSEIALHVVWQILCQLFAFPNGVEEERTVVTQTTEHIIHVQISLNMASHEVRGLNLVS